MIVDHHMHGHVTTKFLYRFNPSGHLARDFCVGPARKSHHFSDILNPLLTKLIRNVSKQIFVNVDFKCVHCLSICTGWL